jgi:hypothetical protein
VNREEKKKTITIPMPTTTTIKQRSVFCFCFSIDIGIVVSIDIEKGKMGIRRSPPHFSMDTETILRGANPYENDCLGYLSTIPAVCIAAKPDCILQIFSNKMVSLSGFDSRIDVNFN